jgi:molybdopterin molybdotransferase
MAISVDEALTAVLAQARPLAPQKRELTAACDLVLAESVISETDSPPFDKSMMDGYAVRAAEAATGRTLRVIGELNAGVEFAGNVGAGEALRIMTGAPMPAGADAVIRLEDVDDWNGGRIRVRKGISGRGVNVIPRAAMMRSGAVVLGVGHRLRPQELALLAELGRAEVVVHPAPTAAVLATGDELVPPGAPLGPGQIRNSNETLLVAQLRQWGCTVTGLGITRDNLPELRDRIRQGLQADVLVLTGGVSMGKKDLVPQVLEELGVMPVFHRVHLKPGKPVWFGVREAADGPRTLVFALPGNPVSSMVCSELFIRSAVAVLAGGTSLPGTPQPARLAVDHALQEDRPTYFPARIEFVAKGVVATPVDWKGSADLRATIDANGLIAFPAGDRDYRAGEIVNVVRWVSREP